MVDPTRLFGRDAETQALTRFLASVSDPLGMVLEGEPGIGKTTLWLHGVAQARDRGFTVLTARPAAAEASLSYSSLADLLSGVASDVWSDLPDPQRRALDHVLLRAEAGEAPTDPRTVAAAMVAVLRRLTLLSPVLVAIDDLQWLDTSSTHAIAFTVRRLTGRVGVLASTRSDRDSIAATAWLQLPAPDALHRLSLQPFEISGLHTLITERVGTSFPRPTMQKIHELSGGNPFYGLELARSLNGRIVAPTSLPTSLAEVVGARIGSLDDDVRQALLAVACAAAPAVELVAAAVATDVDDLVILLKGAENSGIVEIDGGELRFAHPLLARSVYVDAGPALRRAMHAKLAGLVDDPETRARHLALAATIATASTLESLDVAAELARKRGAPAAAAELLELAIALGPGGDTPERRVRAAGHHVGAGDSGRARDLLKDSIARLSPGRRRAAALMLLAVVELFDNSFLDGVAVLERGLREVGEHPALRGLMLVTLSFALLNVGRPNEASDTVEEAVRVATRSGVSPLLGQALGMRAMVRFVQGGGLDHTDIGEALELEDAGAQIPIAFRPTVQNALLLGWSGQLSSARDVLDALRRACIQSGEEGELIFVSFHACFVAIWRGEFSEATHLAEESVDRARQLGGNVPLFVALTARAAAEAYAGREAGARSDLAEASAASARSGFVAMGEWPATVRGFLEVSQGNYRAALAALNPLIARAAASPEATEINAASFIPDAVEALIQLGRFDEAESLINMLHSNGRRLDRPWMLAVGGRCQSMLLAARGDIDGARLAAQAAMVEHQRIGMPFERARTLLTLGSIERRSRQEQLAVAAFTEASAVFEQLGTPLWLARARAEMLSRQTLTPAEYRVARLTASGMTNGEVAAALFVSPKTVEFHLAGVYRKLGIRSRAELGRHMSKAE